MIVEVNATRNCCAERHERFENTYGGFVWKCLRTVFDKRTVGVQYHNLVYVDQSSVSVCTSDNI